MTNRTCTEQNTIKFLLDPPHGQDDRRHVTVDYPDTMTLSEWRRVEAEIRERRGFPPPVKGKLSIPPVSYDEITTAYEVALLCNRCWCPKEECLCWPEQAVVTTPSVGDLAAIDAGE